MTPRIVHLTTVHPPFDPRIFWKEAVSLAEGGYEVCVVARHTQAETVAGVHLVPLTPLSGRYRRLLLQREAFQIACNLNAAVYHFHDPELIPLAYLLKRATGARIIYDMHEDYRWHGAVEGRLIRALEHWCFRWVDHVIVVDPLLAAWMQNFEVPTTLIANLYKPLGSESIQPAIPARQPSDAFQLIYTGYSSTQRGLPMLLNIAEAAAADSLDWSLDLVGMCRNATDREWVKAKLGRPDVNAVVNRVGWGCFVPSEQMEPYYRQAHVGLVLWQPHPNYSRIPTKFYEYLHHGLPILCSDFPLWRRFIEKHQCGAVVDPSDQAAIMRILKTWATDLPLYNQLAKAALEAAKQYQWSQMEPRLLALYADMIGTST